MLKGIFISPCDTLWDIIDRLCLDCKFYVLRSCFTLIMLLESAFTYFALQYIEWRCRDASRTGRVNIHIHIYTYHFTTSADHNHWPSIFIGMAKTCNTMNHARTRNCQKNSRFTSQKSSSSSCIPRCLLIPATDEANTFSLGCGCHLSDGNTNHPKHVFDTKMSK